MSIKEDSDSDAMRLECRADLIRELSVFLKVLDIFWRQILSQHHAVMAAIIS